MCVTAPGFRTLQASTQFLLSFPCGLLPMAAPAAGAGGTAAVPSAPPPKATVKLNAAYVCRHQSLSISTHPRVALPCLYHASCHPRAPRQAQCPRPPPRPQPPPLHPPHHLPLRPRRPRSLRPRAARRSGGSSSPSACRPQRRRRHLHPAKRTYLRTRHLTRRCACSPAHALCDCVWERQEESSRAHVSAR